MKRKSLYWAAVASVFMSVAGHAQEAKKDASEHLVPAVKLINIEGGRSSFVRGYVPSLAKTSSKDLYFSNTFEDWQKGVHPAPRRQYVVTMKGKLQFKVSDGSTFVIEPGVVLIADDTAGEGHSWNIVEGSEWVRVYIPVANDNFIAEK